jgi:hypothetical protein
LTARSSPRQVDDSRGRVRIFGVMKALDGQVPDGVQIMLNTSVGKQVDAGVVGGPPNTSG